MNERQRLFVKEYLVDRNATRAAIAAGYSERTARQVGSRLLTNVDIREAVDGATIQRANRLDLSADKVLIELSRLGFSNMLDYITVQGGDAFVDLSKLTKDQAAAIQEVTVEDYTDGRSEKARDIRRVKLKLTEKLGALELLGKHLKLFSIESAVPVAVQIVTNVTLPPPE